MNAEYALYVESGPRMKTTMVHVLDLLGCVANGPTTEAALEATPGEIRHFLRFLAAHGEHIDPGEEFAVRIAQHVMDGPWVGYGNPAPGFEPDFQPLTRKELPTHLQRLCWIGQTLTGIARDLPPASGTERRPIREILRHAAAANAEFVRVAGLGKSDEMKAVISAIEASEGDLGDNLARLFVLTIARFEAITDEERTQEIQRGASLYTARRGLRRGLEHAWEHLREIERRLEGGRDTGER